MQDPRSERDDRDALRRPQLLRFWTVDRQHSDQRDRAEGILIDQNEILVLRVKTGLKRRHCFNIVI